MKKNNVPTIADAVLRAILEVAGKRAAHKGGASRRFSGAEFRAVESTAKSLLSIAKDAATPKELLAAIRREEKRRITAAVKSFNGFGEQHSIGKVTIRANEDGGHKSQLSTRRAEVTDAEILAEYRRRQAAATRRAEDAAKAGKEADTIDAIKLRADAAGKIADAAKARIAASK